MRASINKTVIGVLLATAAGVLWAVSSPVSRVLGDRGVDMTTIVFFRILGTTIILALWLWCRHPEHLRISAVNARKFFIFSLFSPVSLYLGFMLSVVYLPVATALVLHYTFPIVVVLCSSFVTGEHPNRYDTVGAVLVVCGVVLSVLKADWSFDTALSVRGILWGVLAVAGMSMQSLFGRAGSLKGKVSIIEIFFYSHLFGLFWMGLYKTFTTGWSTVLDLTPLDWSLNIANMLLSTIMGHSAYYAALRFIPASTASLVASIEIVCAVALTSWIVQSWPTMQSMIGCVFIFTAIFLASIGHKNDGK